MPFELELVKTEKMQSKLYDNSPLADTAGGPPVSFDQLELLSPFHELKESRDHLTSIFSKNKLYYDFPENYSEIVDNYFQKSIQESETGKKLFTKKNHFAIIAVGGYGRQELCLQSDIDVLILFKSKIPPAAKKLTEEIFYPLWDLGLDLGHGTRTIKDCVKLSAKDYEVLTSLLDARFLCGDSLLFLSLKEILQKKIIAKKKTAIHRWLDDQNKIRMGTKGDGRYLLEPDLKEGIGGLRDFHHILWLSKVFFDLKHPRDLEYSGKLSHKEFAELEENLGFIRLVRSHLHLLSKRKNDSLSFEYQEIIAKELGYKKAKNSLAVEQFLGDLHTAMTAVNSLHRSFVNSYVKQVQKGYSTDAIDGISGGLRLDKGEWYFNSATSILSSPFLLIEIFEQSAHTGLHLSLEAKRLVREFMHLVYKEFISSEKAGTIFLNILKMENAYLALDQMLETGFLFALIPEFEKVKDMVLYDTYHIYPVGRHLLQTIKRLKTVYQENDIIMIDLFSDLENNELLLLAGLFHDIGKGGKNHSRRGSTIAGQILTRIGYDKKGIEEIKFLVKNHLLLSETATRRDLNDEKVIVQCAREIEKIERLKMLYLLTWADASATGEGAWNDWIGNLVQELFFKILHTLEQEELATPKASRKVKNTTYQVRKLYTGEKSREELDKIFDVMSPRYLLETNPKDIIKHIQAYSELQNKTDAGSGPALSLQAQNCEPEGCWEMVFITKDRPGLFSKIAGALALNNINILSAHIYTWLDYTAVDIFKITNPLDSINPERTWKKIEDDLNDIFSGNMSIDHQLAKKAKSSIFTKDHKPVRETAVNIDNDLSDFFTIIEVFADDRIGLLYLITSTLFQLGLNIKIAKIATKVDQVADVFYVRDLEGQKVDDLNKIEEIKAALNNRLRTTI